MDKFKEINQVRHSMKITLESFSMYRFRQSLAKEIQEKISSSQIIGSNSLRKNAKRIRKQNRKDWMRLKRKLKMQGKDLNKEKS
jgi:hypothetical protein